MARALIDVGDGTLIAAPPKTPDEPLPVASPPPALPPAAPSSGVPSPPPVVAPGHALIDVGDGTYIAPPPSQAYIDAGGAVTPGAADAIDDYDEASAIADANDPDLTDLLEWDFADPFGIQLLSADTQPLKGGGAISAIAQACSSYGVDPLAAVADALHEGASGAVGDSGTSYGPFQLHKGGALPAQFNNKPDYSPVTNAWAWSLNGIQYAVRGMVNGHPSAKGLKGHSAVAAIVNGFERPADKKGAYKTRAAEYDHLVSLGGDWAKYAAPLFKGPVTGGAVDTTPIKGSAGTDKPYVPAGVNAQWRGLVDVFGSQIPAEHDNVAGLSQSLVGVFK